MTETTDRSQWTPPQLAVTAKGQTVVIVREDGTQVQVRYPNGRTGWLDSNSIVRV